MIRKLRIKFICVIMSIVMVLLCVILGGVVHFTAQSMEKQSLDQMRKVSQRPDHDGPPPPGKHPEDVHMPYFEVILDGNGKILDTIGQYYDLSDRDALQEIVDAAMESGKESGRLRNYDLRFFIAHSPRGITVVFSDITSENATLDALGLNCLGVFVVSIIVFYGISVAFSRWAVRPVEEAWNQQRQFVADASHELKTPLTVILANAELMQNEDTDESERKTFSRNILSMSYQMRSLVENLLEMARVDNGTPNMKFENLDFSQLVGDAVLSFQLLYSEKDMGLQWDGPEEILLRGSEQHLYQLLDILLDNALKYSLPRGTVCVNLSRNARFCTLAVVSPGEPLSKEELKDIFKRFYRGDKARAMNGSCGLGLSIAESIVSAHKGKIWAESSNDANIFYVQLPAVEN